MYLCNKENTMARRIIEIDENLCNGCALCADACHEGAISMVDGKARLTRPDYCDGLGDCLPACPAGAIRFITVEEAGDNGGGHSCPGQMTAMLKRKEAAARPSDGATGGSELMQWPCQLKLVPPKASYFDASDLLIAATCTAFSYGDFHKDFMKGRITMIGCPKLDGTDYSIKLAGILKNNDIRSITLCRMEVPCCGGLVIAVQKAIALSGKDIGLETATISTDGHLIG